jgi:glycopeptide antibiotics resistance protein
VHGLRRVTVGATFVYLVALVAIAFWPVRVDENAGDLLYRLFTWLYRHGAPRWLNYDFLEFSANVILFIPVGLFVVILAGARRWWLGILAGLVTSCAIEVGQLMFLPARSATVVDVVANTSGAVLGTVLAVMALAIAHAQERRALAKAQARVGGRARLSPWA